MPGLRVFLPALLFSSLLSAQTDWTTVRVSSSDASLTIYVDGTEYSGSAAFVWTPGSAHVLMVPKEQVIREWGKRVTFLGWMDSNGLQYGSSWSINIVAQTSTSAYFAMYQVEYEFDLNFYTCPSAKPEECSEIPATIYINGEGYWKNTALWFEAGLQMLVEVVPNEGFAFAGWLNSFADRTSPAQSFVVSSGQVLQPQFMRSGRALNVTLDSSPPGMQVSADGITYRAPQVLAWVPGSSHNLRPVSPQQDAANHYWVFGSWSDGGAEEHTSTGPDHGSMQVITATYLPGAIASVRTDPANLKLSVDGADTYLGFNYVWAVGSTHKLSAPEESSDKAGRKYSFRGWTDGVQTGARDVTIGSEAVQQGLTLVARYELLGRLTIESAPGAVSVTVGGANCLTPCTIDRAAGSSLSIAAPTVLPLSDSLRLDFDAWEDQAPRERVWTFTAGERKLRANYRTMYRVATASDPAEGATVLLEPASGDSFYASGTEVVATARPKSGFKFRRWGGDLEGTWPTGRLSVTQALSVVARLDKVPYIGPAGVMNAAGVTPVDGVAAGSIVAIYGANLASSIEVGPASPLAQTLAGVTVQVNGRLLPLYFVSPEQINALLPSDFAAGDYRLTVESSGQPDVSGSFRVVRNAPGLFVASIDSVLYAIAIHANGKPVLPSDPARADEVLTLYGTGFGPCSPAPLDGFAVPPEVSFRLIDPVELQLDGVKITPQRAIAAPGYVGVTAVTFQVPQGLSPGAIPLKARANGLESNTVLLPVTQ